MSSTIDRLLELRADRLLLKLEQRWPYTEQKRIELVIHVRELLYLVQTRESMTSAERKRRAKIMGQRQERIEHFHFIYGTWPAWDELEETSRAAIHLLYPRAGVLTRCPQCGHWLMHYRCMQEEGQVKCGFAWTYETIPEEVRVAFNELGGGSRTCTVCQGGP